MTRLMLEDLKLVIPTIDILETRNLFGGSGPYSDSPYIPPIPPIPDGDDPNRPDNIDPLPIPELPVPEIEIPEINPDYIDIPNGNDDGGEHDEHDNGWDNDNDWDKDNDNQSDDRNDDHGGGSGHSDSGGNGSLPAGFGVPQGNLADHLWTLPYQSTPTNCWVWSIYGVLRYFNAAGDTLSLDAEPVTEYLTHIGLHTEASVNQAVAPALVWIATAAFFEYRPLETNPTIDPNAIKSVNDDAIRNAIDAGHPVLASTLITDADGSKRGHAVVIVGHEADGSYKLYDPGIGTKTSSNNTNLYHGGIQIIQADEITGINRNYMEYCERKADERNEHDKHAPDDGVVDGY
ncbi:cysteine peptidase family C39 domain-containing protein [Viscerimonas tarda]